MKCTRQPLIPVRSGVSFQMRLTEQIRFLVVILISGIYLLMIEIVVADKAVGFTESSKVPSTNKEKPIIDDQALIKAAKTGQTDTVKVLVKNSSQKQRWVALLISAKQGHLETVKVLVESGVDINTKDDEFPGKGKGVNPKR